APESDRDLGIRAEMDMERIRQINETAYGFSAGEFPPMSPLPGTEAYLASLDGETVGTTVTWDRGFDTEVTLVATLPEARGRGVAKRLLGSALERERENGKS